MSEKTAWGMRKKHKHRPKDVKISNDDIGPAQDTGPRPLSSWRKSTLSRPETPTVLVTEDTHSETASEANTPRRSAKPKLVRYLSGLHPKAHLDHVDRNEDWWNETENELVPKQPPGDPEYSLQSTFSHMLKNPNKPIPGTHFSGLFQLFEDYRKMRLDQENMSEKMQELVRTQEKAAKEWAEAEILYQTEIRRLQVLIAHGPIGAEDPVARAQKARMDSVVKRKKVIRNKATAVQLNSPAQLEEQIKATSRKIFRYRPASPSSQMVALSRKFSATGSADDIPVGTPPKHEHNGMLSRKMMSELDLANMRPANASSSASRSVESEFSWNRDPGDPLPDELDNRSVVLDSTIGIDVLADLQELGVLVARKQGINSKRFTDGLMCLLAAEPRTPVTRDDDRLDENDMETSMTLRHSLRHAQSQPLLGIAQKRRRHFSFEPGDDTGYPTAPLESSREPSRRTQNPSIETLSLTDTQKPSKIPSPLQRPGFGSVRREGSLSSQQNLDDRRDSRSSVVTAFRENSRGVLRPTNSGSVHAAVRAYEKSKSK